MFESKFFMKKSCGLLSFKCPFFMIVISNFRCILDNNLFLMWASLKVLGIAFRWQAWIISRVKIIWGVKLRILLLMSLCSMQTYLLSFSIWYIFLCMLARGAAYDISNETTINWRYCCTQTYVVYPYSKCLQLLPVVLK